MVERAGLLRAIFESRLPAIDARRRELFDERQASQSNPDVRDLLDCLCRPLLQMTIEAGQANFARLLSQALRLPALRELRNTYAALTPCGYAIGAQIQQRLPNPSDEVFAFRMIGAFTMVLDAIADPSLYGLLQPAAARPEAAYEIAMTTALGALCAEGTTGSTPRSQQGSAPRTAPRP